jgi:HK97 family phage portal protein
MALVEKIAQTAGQAVGTFERARLAARIGKARRPGIFDATAKQVEYQQGWTWERGDVGKRQAERAIQNSWIYSAIDTIAGEASAANFQVIEHHGVDEEPTQISNHPLEQLIRRPNPYMGQAFLWRYSYWWLKLDGNFYWFLWVVDGKPREIWPLPSFAVRARGGNANRIIDHYDYNVGGRIYKIPAELIVHVKQPNPFDPFDGLSELVAAMLPADSDTAMQKWNGAFFGKNNVMPSAIINLSSGDPNAPINPADRNRLQADLDDDYSAFERKTLVTSANSVTATLLGWNAKDMDFLGGRQFTKEEIWGIFKLSTGLYDPNATEANAKTARNTLLGSAVWPMLVLTAEQLTAELVEPFYGPRQIIDPGDAVIARALTSITGRQVEPPSRLIQFEAQFEDIRPVNREMELKERDSARGVLTVDEIRKDFFQKEKIGDERGNMLETEIVPAGGETDDFGFGPDLFSATSAQPSDALTTAIDVDLRKWQKKASRAIKAGKSAAVNFESSVIPPEISGELILKLGQARSLGDVKAAFSEVAADVPFWVAATTTTRR